VLRPVHSFLTRHQILRGSLEPKYIAASSTCFLYLGNSHARVTSTRESLHRQDLEVQVILVEAVLSPEVEVVGHGDSPGRALALAHREVLSESRGSGD
jgi:hypothetical protein